MKKFQFLSTLLGLFLAACWFTACQKDTSNGLPSSTELQVTDRANGDSKVFPPSAHPYGKSYREWTKAWLAQWFNEDCDNKPWEHPENVLFYTEGSVYMLSGIAELGGSADISVPHGKALLFPLVNTWWNVCPGELEQARINENNPNLTAAEYIERGVNDGMAAAGFTNLSVTVDGAEVGNMNSYKFLTGAFDVTGQPCDVCITGNPQPMAMGGYFVILKPLSIGQHTVHYHMDAPGWGGAVQDATFNITVE